VVLVEMAVTVIKELQELGLPETVAALDGVVLVEQMTE
jgi:hypothetical protein